MRVDGQKIHANLYRFSVKGLPFSLPNPMVGCVIVHNDSIIGQGYHKQCGSHHAEVNAIASVENKKLLSNQPYTLALNLVLILAKHLLVRFNSKE